MKTTDQLKYVTATATTPTELNELVSDFIDQGFSVHGSPYVFELSGGSRIVCQALVKT